MDITRFTDKIAPLLSKEARERNFDSHHYYLEDVVGLAGWDLVDGRDPEASLGRITHLTAEDRKLIVDCAVEVVDALKLRTPIEVPADHPRVQECMREYQWAVDILKVDPAFLLEETRKSIENAVNYVRRLNSDIEIEYHPLVAAFEKLTPNMDGGQYLDARDDVEAPLRTAVEAICQESGIVR